MGGSTVKFIVDEMPFFNYDCPFYNGVSCKLDDSFCEYMDVSPKERGNMHECIWLKEEKK